MRTLTLVFFIGMLISLSSCRTDFETVASTGDLEFSKKTVYLDTVFKNIGSSTYNLKVYNRSKNDITIPSIKLENGLNSKFRMTIDGMQGNEGKAFENVTLLAKDSLYIFIETTAITTDDTEPKDEDRFRYTDKILFASAGKTQEVELVTLIQDAVFLFPPKDVNGKPETLSFGIDENGKPRTINYFELKSDDPTNIDEIHFTNEKPYVIYGYAGIEKEKKLIIDAGARVYFHSESGIIVGDNASIIVDGSQSITDKLENEVIFEGDRLEPDFEDTPGQWGTIWLTNGSTNHKLNHLTIKNATVGLLIQNNDGTTVQIKNTQIYNCSNYGILAQNAKINGENMVINNAGQASLACTYGGDYKFTHCTFNNNWNSSSQVSVLVNNYILGAIPEAKPLTAATFNNCIIYGSYSNEMFLNKKSGTAFEYQFNNCLLKFDNTSNQYTNNPEYQFNIDPNHYKNIILNKDPKFLNVSQNKFNIDETSAAYKYGGKDYRIETDILGVPRTTTPDIGAYQSAPFTK